jgi:hypothetical protein
MKGQAESLLFWVSEGWKWAVLALRVGLSTCAQANYDPHTNYKSGLRRKKMTHYRSEKGVIFIVFERHESMIYRDYTEYWLGM